jgi:hypothetical protein
MNTNRETNRSETVLSESIVLSDAALDHVVGGCASGEHHLNLQPPKQGEAKAGRALVVGFA